MKTTSFLSILSLIFTQAIFCGSCISKVAHESTVAQVSLHSSKRSVASSESLISRPARIDERGIGRVMNDALLPSIWGIVFDFLPKFDPIRLKTFSQGGCFEIMDAEHLVIGNQKGELALCNIPAGCVVRQYRKAQQGASIGHIVKQKDTQNFAVSIDIKKPNLRWPIFEYWHRDSDTPIKTIPKCFLMYYGMFNGAFIDAENLFDHDNGTICKVPISRLLDLKKPLDDKDLILVGYNSKDKNSGELLGIAEFDADHFLSIQTSRMIFLRRKSDGFVIAQFDAEIPSHRIDTILAFDQSSYIIVRDGVGAIWRKSLKIKGEDTIATSAKIGCAIQNVSKIVNIGLWDKDHFIGVGEQQIGMEQMRDVLVFGRNDGSAQLTVISNELFKLEQSQGPDGRNYSRFPGKIVRIDDNHFAMGFCGRECVEVWRFSLAKKLQAILQAHKNQMTPAQTAAAK